MKFLILFFNLFVFSLCNSNAQLTNTRQGVWSDNTIWSGSHIPGSNDNVVLNFDIVIDADAWCRSLTLNGHNATVSPGINLYVTGDVNQADTLLYEYAEIDTTVTPADTSKTMYFYYDDLKRNTSVVTSEYNSYGLHYKNVKSLFYNENERLPFKMSSSSLMYDHWSGDTSYGEGVRFYRYLGSKLVADSGAGAVYYYTYLPGIILAQTVYSNGSTYVDTFYMRYDAAGNITQQVDSTHHNLKDSFNYIYDSHPNPFYNTLGSRFEVVYEIESFVEAIFTKNNALEIEQYEDGRDYHAILSYEYNSNRYPKTVWGYFPRYPNDLVKAVYFYGP